MRANKVLLTMALSTLLVPIGGCKSKLETGYEPTRLGASEAQRRGFYASPFSPEARAASNEDPAGQTMRPARPGQIQ